jgi:hypothetical protein
MPTPWHSKTPKLSRIDADFQKRPTSAPERTQNFDRFLHFIQNAYFISLIVNKVNMFLLFIPTKLDPQNVIFMISPDILLILPTIFLSFYNPSPIFVLIRPVNLSIDIWG